MLQNEHRRVPVTALAFYDNFLLAGEGNTIHTYNAIDASLLTKHQAFEENQQIHGLLTSNNGTPFALAWGGSLIKPFTINQENERTLDFSPCQTLYSPDWILHAAETPPSNGTGNEEFVAFVTAHNGLIVLKKSDLSMADQNDVLSAPDELKLLVPGSNCILYSAQISWLSPTLCLVAAGTAFGDVILWSCEVSVSAQDSQLSAKTTVHYTFSAHEGSVFGVQVSSPPKESSSKEPRMLATCSDDRTVRIWDISDLSVSCSTLLERQRDTGFGSDQQENLDFAPPCLAKAMGHVSRIWHVRFLNRPASVPNTEQDPIEIDQTLVASFGEDAAYNLWSLRPTDSPDPGLPCSLQQMSSKIAHSGKHIWSVAVSPAGAIATGGADGGIAIHNLPPRGQNSKDQPLEISQNLLPSSAPSEKAKDNYRAYTLLDPNTLLCTTDMGRILVISLPKSTESSTEFSIRELSPSLASRNYSVVASAAELGFISDTSGDVYLYSWFNDFPLWNIAKTGRKTAGLFACTVETKYSEENVYLLVTSVGSKDAEILQINSQMPANQTENEVVQSRWKLELPDVGFIVTSFTVKNLGEYTLAVLGSRNGAIAVIRLYGDNEKALIELLLPGVHGKEAVTSLLALSHEGDGSTSGSKTSSLMLHSVGRDGAHAIHRLQVNQRTACTTETSSTALELSPIHNLPLPFGPNVEGVTRAQDKSILVWGFRGKNFVAYNLTTQQEIMNVECGGAHRNWAFQPLSSSTQSERNRTDMQGGTFIWTKASKLYYRSTEPGEGYRRFNSGAHGREIKTVALFEDDRTQIFATGAEDTDIKLFSYDNSERLQCLQTLKKHNTGIQHLQFLTNVQESGEIKTPSEKSIMLLSSGGCEEFYIWGIHNDSSSAVLGSNDVGVVCISTHPRSGKSDLRIMGFEASFAQKTAQDDRGGNKNLIIQVQMAYSDSTLKRWMYDIDSSEWSLACEGEYLSACLTGVFSVPSCEQLLAKDGETGGSTASTLITTSTDGHLALWPPHAQHQDHTTLQWTRRIKVHQNAILASFVYTLNNGVVLVATGGDDNAIGLTVFSPLADKTLSTSDISSLQTQTYLISRAHAAAVTGLTIYESSAENGEKQLILLSVGLDQRVKSWNLKIDTQGVLSVKRKENFGSAVADAAGLVLCRLGQSASSSAEQVGGIEKIMQNQGVLVVGVGVEKWRSTI